MAQINLVTFPWKIRPVEVAPDGVILVSVPADTPAREIERVAQLLQHTLNAMLPEEARIQIILAYEGITVEGLDEKMINQCGWQRIPPS